jgi:hypothetical protein
MPQLLIPTDSTTRRMDAVMAVFRARLRNGALDAPRAARVGRPLIAQAIRPAARPAIAAGQWSRGPSIAEATSPVRPIGRKPPRSPTRALVSVIRRADDRQEHR